jgi:hypothetical protein
LPGELKGYYLPAEPVAKTSGLQHTFASGIAQGGSG